MSNITQACRDISELTPLAQKACNLFLSCCAEKGLKVCITETYRSQDRQNWLYTQGRTRSGNIVTWTKNSRHTSRRAWDICQDIKGREYSDSTFFASCGDIAKKLNIDEYNYGLCCLYKKLKTPKYPYDVSTKYAIDCQYFKTIQLSDN